MKTVWIVKFYGMNNYLVKTVEFSTKPTIQQLMRAKDSADKKYGAYCSREIIVVTK